MFKRLFIFTLLWLALLPAKGTHIVGGEMNYTYLGSDVYLIRLDLYIDCKNGSADAIASDATAFIGVFDGKTGNMISGFPREIGRKGPTRVVKTNYNCIVQAPNACVDQYYYEVKLTLPPRTGGYYVSFQRCCRNGSITNLANPGATGANYWTLIPDPRTLSDGKANSSARFKELPPNFLCTNTPLKFDHAATDADGDSLVYELFQPFLGGDQNDPRPDNTPTNGYLQSPPFTNVSYNSPYTWPVPINGNPPLTIDPKTGFLTLTPTRVGQFVVGIIVKEYRNGKLISSTRRDYQFNVQSCVIDVVASFFVPNFICGYTYKFQNQSSSAQRYHWDFGFPGKTNDTSNLSNPQVTFPGPGSYKVRLYAYKNKCLDSFVATLNIVEPQIPQLPKDTTICPGGLVSMTSNVVGDSYKWSTGDTSKSVKVNKAGLFWLEVKVKSCFYRDSVQIAMDNAKINGMGDTVYCSNSAFVRQLSATAGWKKYLWSTGDTVSTISIKKVGNYWIRATSKFDCITTDTLSVSQYSPVKVEIADTTVCVGVNVTFQSQSNTTLPNITTQWSTGNTGYFFTTKNPGLYWAEVTVGKCSKRDSFTLSNFPNDFQLGGDLRFCEIIDTFLNITLPGVSQITWNSEITGSSYHLLNPGQVVVRLTNSHGCREADSLMVYLFMNPNLNLGSDTTLCLSENPILDAGANMRSYLWMDGSTERFKVARDSGLYWVKVVDQEGCKTADSLVLNKKKDLFPSQIWMPNAFTPNGDNRNDFYPLNQYKVKGALYEVKIFDRWGGKIAEFNSPDVNWDGNINGNPAQEGVYVYTVSWVGCDNERHFMYGNFTLMR